MEPIALTLIILLILAVIFQTLRRSIAEDSLQQLQSDLHQLLVSIESAKKESRLTLQVPRSALARAINREYMKLFLENRLNGRIKRLADSHFGHKPEIK